MIETNHKKIAHKLKKRGWDKESISHSVKVLKKAEKNKPEHIKKLDKSIYWIFIVLIIVGNAMIFFGLVPIFIFFPDWISAIIMALLGVCVGFFIDILIRHHDFNHHHYLSAVISITTAAVASLFIIFSLINSIISAKNWYITTNPIILLTPYIMGNIIPHILFKASENKNGY